VELTVAGVVISKRGADAKKKFLFFSPSVVVVGEERWFRDDRGGIWRDFSHFEELRGMA